MTAPAEFLLGAAENPEMGVREWTALLRNPAAPAEALRCVGGDRMLTANHRIRRLLVRHPHTPLVLARRFLPFLFWKDLLELSLAPSAHPALQRQAERILRGKLAEISTGERITLARRAGRPLIPRLAESVAPPVLQALLDNPRLTESDVRRIAERRATPAATLGYLAGHHRWSTARGVRLALVENPATPRHAALALVTKLDRRDLQRTADNDNVPRFVRIGANRHLQRTSGRRTSARAGSP